MFARDMHVLARSRDTHQRKCIWRISEGWVTLTIYGRCRMEYYKVEDAIRDANYEANTSIMASIGWNQEISRWVVYNPQKGAPKNTTPEFLCVGSGHLPLPLSTEAIQIFDELFNM